MTTETITPKQAREIADEHMRGGLVSLTYRWSGDDNGDPWAILDAAVDGDLVEWETMVLEWTAEGERHQRIVEVQS